MKQQVFNPYLPSYEYIPDGEPYVYDGRVYVYGSHDRFNGPEFCMNDYVCWSAPVDDLSDWRYDGVIYSRTQDPLNVKGNQYLYAPDMQKGLDGRYYLYYALNLTPVISVAVCNEPDGKFEFYGHVKCQNGRVYGQQKGDINNFDPGIFIDDGRIYLYTGFAPTGVLKTFMKARGRNLDGGFCIELEADMLTMKSEPVMIAPGPDFALGTSFEGHAFFEASSMRKIGQRYYFVYSSVLSHELCYAISNRPDGDFQFCGTIVSNGDVGWNGQTQAVNYTGNTHGSIVEIQDKWYIFYHRQTNGHCFSRQACAEQIEITETGQILQAEMTSCGLNGKPLAGTGTYEARIACNLSSKDGTYHYGGPKKKKGMKIHPYFTQSGVDRESSGDQYIANMQKGSWAGFKYFDFHKESEISVCVRGSGKGAVNVYTEWGKKPVAEIPVESSADWCSYGSKFQIAEGKWALYFEFIGTGALDFYQFTIK